MPETLIKSKFQFTIDELQEFLKEKWKKSRCEICLEENSYSLNAIPKDGPDNGRDEIVGSISIIPITDGSIFSTLSKNILTGISLHCNNCGNMKILSAGVIRDWLDRGK